MKDSDGTANCNKDEAGSMQSAAAQMQLNSGEVSQRKDKCQIISLICDMDSNRTRE